jgi:hypothetical protein
MVRALAVKATLKEKILQMDLPGASLILATACRYVPPIQDGGVKKPWNNSGIIGLLVGFILIIITFAVVEQFSFSCISCHSTSNPFKVLALLAVGFETCPWC